MASFCRLSYLLATYPSTDELTCLPLLCFFSLTPPPPSIHPISSLILIYSMIQILLNGSRLGFYEPIRQGTMSILGRPSSEQLFPVAVFAGAMSGIIGASLGNPLFLVKARMQVSRFCVGDRMRGGGKKRNGEGEKRERGGGVDDL